MRKPEMQSRPARWLAVGVACIALAGCTHDDSFTPQPGEAPQAMQQRYLDWSAHRPGWGVTASGLRYHRIDDPHPSGASPHPGSIVTVQCEGRFLDGRLFFATTPDQPLIGPLAKLVKGWQQGLLLMHAGETWEFVLPPELAYGEKGWTSHTAAIPSIPPGTALLFKIELIAVAEPPPESERKSP
ncbi:MAG: FKBP-type peptidyl-prolyl cis-trans isomerase [Rhizomicrobium sp.]